MDSVVDFKGSDKLGQLSPALKNNLHDLVDFHEYIKYSNEYKKKQNFTCGPFEGSTEWELMGKEGTEYNINEYGFRGKWPSTSNRKKLAVFGDSCTFGVGVDEKDLYTTVLEDLFKQEYEVYNFGMVGSSIDNIVKCYSVAERLIGFDRALFMLPDFSRFCWPQYEKEWQHTNMILGPGLDENNSDHMDYVSHYWDELEVNRTINYLNWMNDIANINDSLISVWSWSRATNDIIRQVMPAECVALVSPEDVEIDHARDHQHPGPKSHKAIAELWWQTLVLNGE